MSAPEVTVVIPTRNREKIVAGAVASALGQTEVSVEVIVIDDASSDGTAALLAGIGDDRLRVARQPTSRGVSAARNHGLEHARGEWVAFLDDDDLWAPDWLSTAVTAGRLTGAGLVYGGRWLVRADRQVIGARPGADLRDLPDSLSFANTVGVPAAVVMRTDLIRSAEGFDERLSAFADWEAWIRMLRVTSAAEIGDLLIAYTVYPDNMVARNPFGVAEELERFMTIVATGSDFAIQRTPVLRWMADGCERSGARRPSIQLWWRAFRSSREWMDLVRWLQAVIRPRVELAPMTYAAPPWLRAAQAEFSAPAETPPGSLAAAG